MRPIRLKMSAFGAYAGINEIEFDVLGTEGIYLITGDTGAGKTTIFDAITYALYGRTSGENRDGAMMRSQYAVPTVPTEVELDFLYREKLYHVRRNPEYTRPKVKGTGETKQKAEVELILPDGAVLTGKHDVDDKIEDILGVNYEQFSRIIMIAQGAFQKFLFASTNERQNIFRRIFKTERYEALQKELKLYIDRLDGERLDLKKSVKQYIRDVVCDEQNELYPELERACADQLQTGESILLIKKILQEDETIRDKVVHEIEDVDKSLDKVNEKLGMAKGLEKVKKQIAEDEKLLPERQAEHRDWQAQLVELRGQQPVYKELQEKITLLKKELEEYNALEKLEKELKKAAADIEKKEEKREELFIAYEEKKEKKASDSARLDGLQDIDATFVKQEKVLSDLENRISSVEKLEEKVKQYEHTKKEQEKAQRRYKEISEIYNAKDTWYKQNKKMYLDAQAGILAEHLEEGRPCPVCGALHHPHPAALASDTMTKEELEQEEREIDELKEEVRADSERACSLSGVLQTLREQIQHEKAAVFFLCTGNAAEEGMLSLQEQLKKKKKDMKAEKKAAEQAKERLEAERKEKRELEAALSNADKEIEFCRESLDRCEKEIAGLEGEYKTKQQRAKEEKRRLKFASRKEAEESMQRQQAEAEMFEKKLERCQEKCSAAGDSVKEISAKLQANKNQVAEAKELQVEACEQEKARLINAKQELEEKKNRIDNRISINSSALENIDARKGNLEELEEKCKWVRRLSDTANAKINGKEKIVLETYVQMAYFERIIERANVRFMKMSNGQYELKRREDLSGGNALVGLDLDVVDHYNGSVRNVKSLSGGESFQASLALALGVSDEMQMSASGIQLDTMFIDEGFGSLDEESLQQAIGVLMELSGGKRLIGIISHVDGLKQKIDKQIVVKKDKAKGSQAEVLIG